MFRCALLVVRCSLSIGGCLLCVICVVVVRSPLFAVGRVSLLVVCCWLFAGCLVFGVCLLLVVR